MVQPPAGNDAIDEAEGEPTPGAPPRPEEAAARELREHLALCWLFPVDALPPYRLSRRCVIGRADDCDVCLVGRAVSRHHAEIEHADAATLLKDLRSTNGVYLNGVSVTESPVVPGDVLRVGNWVGCFAAGTGAHPGPIRALGPDLWGGDALGRALEPVRSRACSSVPLMVFGESGTGKQLVARALHAWSGRRGSFHMLNCATTSERQIEVELFGRRGRGGGSSQKRPGLVHTARGGTLLLEEPSQLSPALQGRLGRLLTAGGPDSDGTGDPGDVRFVFSQQHRRAGSNGPLADALAESGALELWLPPLRRRVSEIPALFCHFVGAYSKTDPFALDAELIEALCLYTWPGNVRELEFLARQLVALHSGAREIGRQDLPRRVLDAVKRGTSGSAALAPMDSKHAALPAVPTSGRGGHCLESAG